MSWSHSPSTPHVTSMYPNLSCFKGKEVFLSPEGIQSLYHRPKYSGRLQGREGLKLLWFCGIQIPKLTSYQFPWRYGALDLANVRAGFTIGKRNGCDLMNKWRLFLPVNCVVVTSTSESIEVNVLCYTPSSQKSQNCPSKEELHVKKITLRSHSP